MDVAVMSALFALLTLVALAGAVAGLVGLVAGARVGRLVSVVRPHLVGAAAAVTGTATLGSLYYSEIVGYPPCELCWFQRIFMYPTALLLLLALVGHLRRGAPGVPAPEVWRAVLPMSGIGLVIALYHVLIQRIPAAEVTSCDTQMPCSAILVEQFGFITLPVMAGAAFSFALVAGLLARAWAGGRTDPIDDHPVTIGQRRD